MTNRSIALLVLILAFMLSACSNGAMVTGSSVQGEWLDAVLKDYPELRSKQVEEEKVSRVVDGDTFETASGRKVRLIGVNTPESVGGKVEYYGKEASAFTKSQLTNRKVLMFKDAGDTDRYGRLLRYVFVEDEPMMYNELLVVSGYANPMTVPPNVMFADRFTAAERKARAASAGLWAKSNGGDVSQGSSSSGAGGAADARGSGSTSAGGANAAKTEAAGCSEPTIKGNINSAKERIYHVPGGRYYEQTVAEQMFCTEQEAIDAGFRRSKV
ncbi:thermonuclease family protein [Paenibacillus sp. YYML68]|uniref:thermonuclease family protein n=1 Tax=Paenibacillus sp. YYML68 TaxID=2909250 RepID=UPI002490C1EB|nr:thermonuclease family protein [Paenibacillus sp. YYML68]